MSDTLIRKDVELSYVVNVSLLNVSKVAHQVLLHLQGCITTS